MRKNLAYVRSAAIIVGLIVAGAASVVPPQAYALRLPGVAMAVTRADHISIPVDLAGSNLGVTAYARALRGNVELVDAAQSELAVIQSNGRLTQVYFSSVTTCGQQQTTLADLTVGDIILLSGTPRYDGTFVAVQVRILLHHEPPQDGNGSAGSVPANGAPAGPQFSPNGPIETDTGTVVAVNAEEQSFTLQLVGGKQIAVVVAPLTQFSTRLATYSNIFPGALLSVTGWKQPGGSLAAQSVTGASVGG